MTSIEQDIEEIRTIDAGNAPDRFARGWHCLGLSAGFRDGKPHSVEAFGGKMVVWEDSTGKLNVLDSYCRHMGGDLSQGTIKGDDVACPFHDWRWGGDGKCKDIPYAKRVPMRARTAAWPTMEQDGLLFVWNDPEGSKPTEDVAIPIVKDPDFEWTEWVWHKIEIDTNCREIIDNIVDMAHFFYVHYSFPTFFKNIFEGHIATQYFNGEGREDMQELRSKDAKASNGNTSVAAYFGPSFMINDLVYHYDEYDVVSKLINCHYPVSPDKFVLMYGTTVQKNPAFPEGQAEKIAAGNAAFITKGFEQDVEIWKTKTRINNPLLCEQDGPVYQLRRWYEQFYVDVADIQDDMTQRFEYEMDTTKPNEAWRAQVEANMVAKRAAAAAAANA